MINWKKTLALVITAAIVACHDQQPVVLATAPAPAISPASALAQQNVDAVIYQNTSAEEYRLYQQCYELAKLRLDANLARPHDKPAAVIVDIDETVLDNSPFQITNVAKDRTYSPETWMTWTQMARAQALPGAIAFLKYAASRACEVLQWQWICGPS